ncbi:hypothetical protein AN958_09435 [Leucoagaricus sp. SymC.cos]|nr:hypothetical protein AN958_09435 [Leucoagaricus sp. SymC.cos]
MEALGDDAGTTVFAACSSLEGIYRYIDCFGWCALSCKGCILMAHMVHLLHCIQVKAWNGTFFKSTSLQDLGQWYQLGHRGFRCPCPWSGPPNFVVFNTNSFVCINVYFCDCIFPPAPPACVQLLQAGWFPASSDCLHTAFTFDVLNSFHVLTLQGKTMLYDYYHSLLHCTDNLQLLKPIYCYPEFHHSFHIWCHLKSLKHAGCGRDPGSAPATPNGYLALECPACPHPGKNLPDDWESFSLNLQVSGLRAKSVMVAYSGWSIQVSDVPSLEQLNIICEWLGKHFSPIGSEAYLPTLKSFLKIIDVPFICQDGSRTMAQQVEAVMQDSNLCNHFVLANIMLTLPSLGSALAGITGSIRTGFALSIRRGLSRSSGGAVKDVCVFSQNVNRNYAHVDYLLENVKDTFDVLFIQEPPWRTIRQTVSTTSEEGNDIVSVPKHPEWLYMVRKPTNGQNPHIMAYVHQHLALLCPSMQRDVIDHCDILVLLLFTWHGTVNLLNIYLDNTHTVINLLTQEVDMLPAFIYMGGDFNCHSEVWDPSCTSHPLIAQHLMELASDVGLEWACPFNPRLTHIPHNLDLASSVIDLVFTVLSASASDLPRLDLDRCGPSDHVLISTLLLISESEIWVSCMVIPRESPEESGFLIDLATGLRSLDFGDLDSSDWIEAATVVVAEVFSSTWNAHAKEIIVTGWSRSWWDNDCLLAIAS